MFKSEAFIHLLFQYHPFYTGKRVLNRWDRNDDQCDTAFGQKISAVVNQWVDRSAHVIVCGVSAEENKTGQESKEISAEYTCDIAEDQTVFLFIEETGDTERAKG